MSGFTEIYYCDTCKNSRQRFYSYEAISKHIMKKHKGGTMTLKWE